MFSSDQVALQAYIKAENAEFEAKCKANGSTWWAATVSDPDHWAEYGVTTVAQYERQNLESELWDAFKEAHGVRPRHLDMSAMTDQQIKDLLTDCYDYISIEQEHRDPVVAPKASVYLPNNPFSNLKDMLK